MTLQRSCCIYVFALIFESPLIFENGYVINTGSCYQTNNLFQIDEMWYGLKILNHSDGDIQFYFFCNNISLRTQKNLFVLNHPRYI